MSSSPKFKSDEMEMRHGKPLAHPHNAQEEKERAIALEGLSHGTTLPNEEDAPVGKPGCMHCEMLPTPIAGPGTLFLTLPHTYTYGKILEILADSRYEHAELDSILTVKVETVNGLPPLLSKILDCLTFTEQRDTRARFQRSSTRSDLAQVSDFSDITDLPRFAAHVRSTWLLGILREKRLYSVFQPIVHCDESVETSLSSSIFGYECLMRGEIDGAVVSPADMINMARAAGLLFQLDLAARRSSLVSAATHKVKDKIFVNFLPTAIYDPKSCLNSTVRLIDELCIPRDQVVFEIIESDQLPDMKLLHRIVGYYRENGFGVAMDDVGAGFSSLSLLVDLKPDYVKVDRSLLYNLDSDSARALVARKVIEVARELSITTIAEGVETQAQLNWVRQQGVNLAQGFLFARPAAPPPLRADA